MSETIDPGMQRLVLEVLGIPRWGRERKQKIINIVYTAKRAGMRSQEIVIALGNIFLIKRRQALSYIKEVTPTRAK